MQVRRRSKEMTGMQLLRTGEIAKYLRILALAVVILAGISTNQAGAIMIDPNTNVQVKIEANGSFYSFTIPFSSGGDRYQDLGDYVYDTAAIWWSYPSNIGDQWVPPVPPQGLLTELQWQSPSDLTWGKYPIYTVSVGGKRARKGPGQGEIVWEDWSSSVSQDPQAEPPVDRPDNTPPPDPDCKKSTPEEEGCETCSSGTCDKDNNKACVTSDSQGNTSTTGPAVGPTACIGEPILITPAYNSDDPGESPFGKGWTHNYNMYIYSDEGGIIKLVNAQGKIDIYTLSGGKYIGPGGEITVAANRE